MAKAKKPNRLAPTFPAAETAMDKTTRIVKTMIDGDAEKRQTKLNRLRTARLEREANTPDKPAAKTVRKQRKKPALENKPKAKGA